MLDLFAFAFVLSISIMSIVAWVTHVLYCFGHDMWGFLIAGALFFPIGIVHGLAILIN